MILYGSAIHLPQFVIQWNAHVSGDEISSDTWLAKSDGNCLRINQIVWTWLSSSLRLVSDFGAIAYTSMNATAHFDRNMPPNFKYKLPSNTISMPRRHMSQHNCWYNGTNWTRWFRRHSSPHSDTDKSAQFIVCGHCIKTKPYNWLHQSRPNQKKKKEKKTGTKFVYLIVAINVTDILLVLQHVQGGQRVCYLCLWRSMIDKELIKERVCVCL